MSHLKMFFSVLFYGVCTCVLSSFISLNVWNVNVDNLLLIFVLPLFAIKQGVYFPTMFILIVSFTFILALHCICQKRLLRFIGLHLLLLVLIVIGLVAIAETIQVTLDINFDSVLLGGATLIVAAYLPFIAAQFFNTGKPLGKARFANGWDIFRAGLFSKSGFVFGKSFYGTLRYSGYEPIIVVSGTGGGKTTAIAIPNVLALRDENIVVTDIKGEIYQKTQQYRKSIGNTVLRFEPAAKTTHRYNPLALLRPDHLDEDIDGIFSTLIPSSHDPLWADASRNVAKMLVLYEVLEANQTPTLQTIYKRICDPHFMEACEMMFDTIQTPRIANLFGKFLSMREKTRRDVLINAQEYLSPFDNPRLAYATSGNDIDFKALRKTPMSIYLILPANSNAYGSITAIFFEQMIRLTTENNEPEKNEYTINALIDEFGNIPKIPSIAKGVSFLRSYRIRVCVFVQTISQLKAVYGEDHKESFLSAPTKIAFNITSKKDAEYFS
ncbi:MAG: type IV secretory system conjugative DNA transfer family protein, partial [Rhizobiaceae bacterium]|nr:type IV secretory system conjugative DNA transfer family protein [Rhizobiaceae bacterium]